MNERSKGVLTFNGDVDPEAIDQFRKDWGAMMEDHEADPHKVPIIPSEVIMQTRTLTDHKPYEAGPGEQFVLQDEYTKEFWNGADPNIPDNWVKDVYEAHIAVGQTGLVVVRESVPPVFEYNEKVVATEDLVFGSPECPPITKIAKGEFHFVRKVHVTWFVRLKELDPTWAKEHNESINQIVKEHRAKKSALRVDSIEDQLQPYLFPTGFQPAYSTVGEWISAKEAQALAGEPSNDEGSKGHWGDWGGSPKRVSKAFHNGRHLRWLSNWKEPEEIAEAYLRISKLHSEGESIPFPYVVCQYFGQTVVADTNGHIREEDLRCFAAIINYCVKEGLLKYAQLAPAMRINLMRIPDDGGQRAMLLFYAFSDYTRDELNKKLHGEYFTNEGDLPSNISWPAGIPGTVSDWLPTE